MNQRIFKTILLWGLLMPSLSARTIEVCPTCPVSSIKKAVELAQAGDEILLKKGLYKEHKILVDKPLRIYGVDYPVVDGNNQGEIFTVTAHHVTIEGLQIQNVGLNYMEDRAGIRIKKASHFKIVRNRMINTFFAIYCAYANDGVIRDNEISGTSTTEAGSGNGIHLWYCKRLVIEGNQVRGHRDGIYFEFADSCRIIRNHSEANLRYGLHFMFSNDDVYSKNTFRKNGAGVAVMYSRRIQMIENRFEENWGAASYGLLLKEIYDAEILQNQFVRNTIGINAESTTRVNYRDNIFSNNGWAIRVAGGCVDNVVTRNNFIGNSFELSMQSAGTNNSFDGNYWSEYTGYDLNRDGTGDVPYRPVKLFSFVVNQTPEAMVLLRSLFIDLLNFSEKVSPVFTPQNVLDHKPLMRKLP